MLVELNLVEQRYKAVLEVMDGATVTDVARRNGVSRQTVHTWLLRYANEGLGSLADKSTKPTHSPSQMPPVVEAKVVELRLAHPGGPADDPRTPPWRGCRAPAVALGDLSGAHPPQADRAGEAKAPALGLQALGALEVHGALADGRHGALLPL